MTPSITLVSVLYKATIGAVVAGIAALAAWPFTKLAKIHEELTVQRTNCLQTLQEDGKTQIQLLEKVSDTLNGVRLDLKEQTGFLAAANQRPRARTKK